MYKVWGRFVRKQAHKFGQTCFNTFFIYVITDALQVAIYKQTFVTIKQNVFFCSYKINPQGSQNNILTKLFRKRYKNVEIRNNNFQSRGKLFYFWLETSNKPNASWHHVLLPLSNVWLKANIFIKKQPPNSRNSSNSKYVLILELCVFEFISSSRY